LSAVLSDLLLDAYCLLRDVPEEAFGGESRERYAIMGALWTAQEVANAERRRAAGELAEPPTTPGRGYATGGPGPYL
jgi:hypothetical protein